MNKKKSVILIGFVLSLFLISFVSSAICQTENVYTVRESFYPTSKAQGDAKCAEYFTGTHWCEKSELDNKNANAVAHDGTKALGTRAVVYSSASTCSGRAGICSTLNWRNCEEVVCENRYCSNEALICCEDEGALDPNTPAPVSAPESSDVSYETEQCGFGFFVDGTCTDSCSPASILPESFTYAVENGDVFDVSSECPSGQVCCCPTGQIWDTSSESCIVQSGSYCNPNADGETFADLDALMNFKENYGICVDGTLTIPTNNAWLNFEGTGWIWECWSGANDYSRCFAYGDTSGSCGDGEVNEGEECDGNNLNGQTCETLGKGGGTLACYNNCSFDTSNCFPISPDGCGDAVNYAFATESALLSSGYSLCSGTYTATEITISSENGNWYWGCWDADGGLLALANHVPCQAEKSLPESCGDADDSVFQTQEQLVSAGLCANPETINSFQEVTNGWTWKCSTTSCSATLEDPDTICENGQEDVGEACDGGSLCQNDCTCPDGYVDDPYSAGCINADNGTYVDGECSWDYTSDGKCDLGASSVTFTYTPDSGNDASCGTKNPQTIICPAKLGFFDISNIVAVIIIVGLVYLFFVSKNQGKKKKRKKK